jgi:hypothetical protein
MSFDDVSATAASGAPWPALDDRFLEANRPAPPAFPITVFAKAWRPWLDLHARASTCVDYIAQSLLAAASAVCGARFVVNLTPHWREPLVLWQALVGDPSTGKTPALVAGRRLLGSVKAPAGLSTPARLKSRRSERMVHRGDSQWFDELDVLLARLSRDGHERALALACWTGDFSHFGEELVEVGAHVRRFPMSILGTLQADRLVETLSGIDDGLCSRFLYGWPGLRLDARLAGNSGDSDEVRPLMQRLVDLPGTVVQPQSLSLAPAAAARLEELLSRWRAHMRDADGLEAAWIGKAAGNVVRVAGLLSLMDWAASDGACPCTTLEQDHLDRAQALWADYYWPHARAVFGQAAATIADRRVRRAGRWLRRLRAQTVSREDVRREALCQTVDADTAESVIERLEQYGVLRLSPVEASRTRGPRKRRWEVNPALWAN